VEELAKHKGFYMSPGMPANVTVVTGERTMLQYLFDPFVRSIKSAFVYD
jgi:HlyD family secretion protein/epimerase transport system membrane fusion protein